MLPTRRGASRGWKDLMSPSVEAIGRGRAWAARSSQDGEHSCDPNTISIFIANNFLSQEATCREGQPPYSEGPSYPAGTDMIEFRKHAGQLFTTVSHRQPRPMRLLLACHIVVQTLGYKEHRRVLGMFSVDRVKLVNIW